MPTRAYVTGRRNAAPLASQRQDSSATGWAPGWLANSRAPLEMALIFQMLLVGQARTCTCMLTFAGAGDRRAICLARKRASLIRAARPAYLLSRLGS